LTLARFAVRRTAESSTAAALAGYAAIVGVPLLAAFFPRWAARLALPLLAVTSMGIVVTVPDTERVALALVLVVVAVVVYAAWGAEPTRTVLVVTAMVIMLAAILDSGERPAAIVRSVGCFGVVLAAPLAAWLNALRTSAGDERRPPLVLLVVVHCLVVACSSRPLVHETALAPVLAVSVGAEVAAVLALFAIAPKVTVAS
jgi:hypothetical protein